MTSVKYQTEAFLIIDVQNDFCPGGALAVSDGDAVVAPINALQRLYGVVAATQDWHPREHLSFADNHPGAAAFSTTQMAYGTQVLWPAHCVQRSTGAAFRYGLELDRAQLLLRKGFRPEIDSYSAFFENDRKTVTGLAGYLRERGVEAVTMAGLATDFCVRYSAVDAARLGFRVTVVEDACRAIDLNGSLGEAKRDMAEHGVRLAASAALL